MQQNAFFWDGTGFNLSSPVILLSAAAGICFFWALYVGKGGETSGAAAAASLSVMLSVVLARLIHWYCRPDGYPGFLKAMTDYSAGGFALAGAFFGCFLAAVLLRLLGAIRNLPRMLDCMSLGGCGAIALGRLPVSLFQAAAAGLIFLAVTGWFLWNQEPEKRKDGDAALLVLLFYGASQIVLDGARNDALYLRNIEFVSLGQILGGGAVVMVILIFSLRLIRAGGFRFRYFPVWAAMALMLVTAGYAECYGEEISGITGACMAGTLAAAMLLWRLAVRWERIWRLPTIY